MDYVNIKPNEDGSINDLADYIADNHGECKIHPCRCLKTGWMGRLCENWIPVKSKNWEELSGELRNKR